MRSWCTMAALVVLSSAACVPADESLPLGSAQFTITGRGSPRELTENVATGPDFGFSVWTIHIDRFVLSFKTMTIVNLLDSDQCAYRGRGALANVVFDGAVGSVVQSFNGIRPGACPDVGIRLGVPDDRSVLGDGATVDDMTSMAAGPGPAVAQLEATATRKNLTLQKDEVLHLSLRFDVTRTSTAFGGCGDATRGAKIRPEARYALFVDFASEAFFRDSIGPAAPLRFGPFADADTLGDHDGTITMDELDGLSLSSVSQQYSQPYPTYELPSGKTSGGTFGDYVRAQFMFTVKFGDGGVCNGLAPGTPIDQ